MNILSEHKTSTVVIDLDLGHDLDFELWKSNILFAISQEKLSDCHRTKKNKHII